MFETICTYPLPSDLFAQAIHPSQPLIAVGLASGHVQALRLPSLNESSNNSADGDSEDSDGRRHSTSPLKEGKGTVETAWQTKRHKGSCRSLAFGTDGEILVSAGSEGIIKVADTEAGKVKWKIGVREDSGRPGASTPAPSLVHILTPQTLLLGLDSSALQIHDFRIPPAPTSTAPKPVATHHPHDDYVSSISPLPPSSASTSNFSKQWLSTGGSTLAITDLRRGVMARSEDQETEMLCSVYITDLPKKGSSQGEKALTGSGNGVISLWEKGVWDDLDERIVVDAGAGGGESLDVLVEIPGGVGRNKGVIVGLGDGKIKVVELGRNKVVAEVRHDEVEGVLGLGFEPEGRMVSGGGQIVKVWQEWWEGEGVGKAKREESDSEEEEADSEEDSDQDEKKRKRRKRRKRSKGNDKASGKATGAAFKGLD
ncbi:MAG: WD domain repeat-containing protein 55 [Stictis urceolatum]|nr:WD domain repeat-containing protein 55 [Stictis urceolata]